MSEAELTALGVWTAPVTSNRTYTWSHDVWPHLLWAEPTEEGRVTNIVSDMIDMGAWVTFIDGDDVVIGHRKARAYHPVTFGNNNSFYHVENQYLDIDLTTPKGIYAEAMTDFGDGFGHTVDRWQIRLGATLVDQTRPGLLWAEADELTGGTVAVEKIESIEFGRTVREKCCALLRVV